MPSRTFWLLFFSFTPGLLLNEFLTGDARLIALAAWFVAGILLLIVAERRGAFRGTRQEGP